MTFWVLGTIGHFLLTAHWLKRTGQAASRDELWFQTMVAGTGTLSIALHLIASTTGLTLTRVLLLLLAGHAALAWRNGALYVGRGFSPGVQANLVTRILETAATVAVTAIVIQWALQAIATAEVTGSDAAHYHVPNAVNLALGASPFDLPPTSHLYPMGSSTLAAWFILPVQTPLLTDLVMVLPFLLLVSAAGWVFRQLTSLSGLAWSTWLMLALFGTPLFRSASLMSADLLFAAAAMSFGAALLAPLIRRQLKAADIWLLALSLGLLLGSKVTGLVVAGLLGAPALVTVVILKLRFGAAGLRQAQATPSSSRGEATPYSTAVWAGAAFAMIFAGGIWLVRNWWVWGSPVAPNGVTFFGVTLFRGAAYEATTYLSVLGDMTDKPDYRLWDRVTHFIGIWLGAWFLPGLGALALIPADVIAGRRRADGSSARLWAMIVACVTGAVMAWFLIGAPWTSLEWTEGFSLRYALPWLAILPVVAWVGVFPASLPWYRRTAWAAFGGLAISVAGILVFTDRQQADLPPVPALGVLAASLLLVGVPRWPMVRPLVSILAIGVILGAAALFDIRATQADRLAQETKAAAMASGPRTLGEQIYDAAIAVEARDSQSCDVEGRRFFVTNRFDEAGALQGPKLTNRVFYAARELRATARVRPAMGPCDYLITERAIMDTDKGAALHAALNTSGTLVEVATVADVLLLVHR